MHFNQNVADCKACWPVGEVAGYWPESWKQISKHGMVQDICFSKENTYLHVCQTTLHFRLVIFFFLFCIYNPKLCVSSFRGFLFQAAWAASTTHCGPCSQNLSWTTRRPAPVSNSVTTTLPGLLPRTTTPTYTSSSSFCSLLRLWQAWYWATRGSKRWTRDRTPTRYTNKELSQRTYEQNTQPF